eukprot:CAMPEP_0171656654 /NCGR_PEP_ID=MMETSP0990-20121206/41735_1 /TAXON_ID=483369 /ORGANISM="non described non described, Strain CCMP2098" /LENGTH=87 /DNA_ID=CAMNT_0012237219 /DNA_START=59 /DNA_END=322 /DNA_ORIENTATION=-
MNTWRTSPMNIGAEWRATSTVSSRNRTPLVRSRVNEKGFNSRDVSAAREAWFVTRDAKGVRSSIGMVSRTPKIMHSAPTVPVTADTA